MFIRTDKCRLLNLDHVKWISVCRTNKEEDLWGIAAGEYGTDGKLPVIVESEYESFELADIALCLALEEARETGIGVLYRNDVVKDWRKKQSHVKGGQLICQHRLTPTSEV